jgi:hypothetical protein
MRVDQADLQTNGRPDLVKLIRWEEDFCSSHKKWQPEQLTMHEIVLRYGEFARQRLDRGGFERMTPKACHENAIKLALAKGFEYGYGWVLDETLGIPIEHSWCRAGSIIVEPTLPNPARNRMLQYYGIHLPAHEAWEVIKTNGYYGFDFGFSGKREQATEQLIEFLEKK